MSGAFDRVGYRSCNQLLERRSTPVKLLNLGFALCLVIFLASDVLAALPSRVLQLRDNNEQVAINLGETSGVVRIASTGGIKMVTSTGETVRKLPEAIRVKGDTGNSPHGQSSVWRVQIKAIREEGAALDLRRQVEADSGVSAYVVQVDPWFKVQVGDAASSAEAESLKEKLVMLGYHDAWVTRAELPIQDAALGSLGDRAIFRIEDDGGRLLAIVNDLELMVEPVADSPLVLEVSGSLLGSYRGAVRVTFMGKERLRIDNIIGLEEYLYGVVGAELYSRNREDLAALAAQAVAARTYAIQNLGKHDMEGSDLCSTVHCQVYQGIERESQLIREAVDMTKGQVLVYGGQTISAVYHSSSGGATAGAEQVWSTRYSGYLRPRPDEAIDPETGLLVELGRDRPGYNWEFEWDGQRLADSLRHHLRTELSIEVPSKAALSDIRMSRQNGKGRVEKLTVCYQDPTEIGESRIVTYEVKKDKIRWVLRRPDGQILPSTCFDVRVEKHNGTIHKVVATGQGNGHGLGLSQAGAVHMSRLGYDYQDILLHYYTDVSLVSMTEYYKDMESRLAWERKGLVQTWVAILGPAQGIDGMIKAVRWAPSGDMVAYGIAGNQGGLWIFNVVTGEKAKLLSEPVLELAWKSDGSMLAVVSAPFGSGGATRRLSCVELEVGHDRTVSVATITMVAESSDIHSPVWMSDSDLLVFGQNGMIYGAQNGVSVPLVTDAATPALTPGGRSVALSRQGVIWLYELATGEAERLCWLGSIKSMVWSQDAKHLAVDTGNEVAVISAGTRQIVAKLPGYAPSWSADGHFLAYMSGEYGSGGNVEAHIWELSSNETQMLAQSQNGGPGTVDWSASGSSLAYGIDGKLHLLTLRR